MSQCSSCSFALLEDLQAKIVGIPYKNNDLSMFVLLPDDVDGLEKVNLGISCLIPFLTLRIASLVPEEPGNRASEQNLKAGCAM